MPRPRDPNKPVYPVGRHPRPRVMVGTVSLPPRLYRVLELISEGLTSQQIAPRLGISHGTVRQYSGQLAQVLESHGIAAHNRTMIATWFLRTTLLSQKEKVS